MQNKAFWEKDLKELNMIANLLGNPVRSVKLPDGYDEPFLKSSILFDQQNKKDLAKHGE